jgi:hypothetical protein
MCPVGGGGPPCLATSGCTVCSSDAGAACVGSCEAFCTNGLCGPTFLGNRTTGGVYWPQIVPGFTRVECTPDGVRVVTVYWTVSTQVPYYGHLMKTIFNVFPTHQVKIACGPGCVAAGGTCVNQQCVLPPASAPACPAPAPFELYPC